MKIAVAIFAKTIGLSSVKTRLAADIGQEKAEAFYRLSLACVREVMEKVVAQNPDVFPHWALAEEEAPLRNELCSFPAMWTGEGGLGQRLANVSDALFKSHDAVFLIGTDSPQISAKRILQIMETLEVNEGIGHVVGDAKDGGFWLWGSRRPLPHSIWNGVTYSASTTLEELVTAVNAHGDFVSHSYRMQDVDVLDDLITLQETFEQKGDVLLPAQKRLLEWLQVHNPIFQG